MNVAKPSGRFWNVVCLDFTPAHIKFSRLPYFFLRQFLKNARFTKQIDKCSRPQVRGSYKAKTFFRFDFKVLLIIWLVAVLIKAVLKLADAPSVPNILWKYSSIKTRKLLLKESYPILLYIFCVVSLFYSSACILSHCRFLWSDFFSALHQSHFSWWQYSDYDTRRLHPLSCLSLHFPPRTLTCKKQKTKSFFCLFTGYSFWDWLRKFLHKVMYMNCSVSS